MGELDEWKLAIAGSIVILIKQLTDLISSWLTKEMAFRQNNRHAKMQLQLDLDIESKTQDLKRQQKIQDKRLEDSLNSSLLEDALKIQGQLRIIRDRLNAKTVNVTLYHNGMAKGFKNYSIRYEEVRDTADALMANYQSKPLSAFYSTIKEFEDKNAVFYKVTDELNDKNKEFIALCKLTNSTSVIVVPLLATEDTLLPTEHTTMLITKHKVEYYLIGTLTVYLDETSKQLGELEVLTYLVNKSDDLMNIYIKNPKVFG